jgi:hypothetical protein
VTAYLQLNIIIIIIIIIIINVNIIVEHWRSDNDRWETVTLCPPQILYELERDRTQATVVVYVVYLTTTQQL